MKNQLQRLFILSAAFIFGTTGLLKLFAVLNNLELLSAPDPIFAFLSNRQLIIISGCLELITVLMLCTQSDRKLKLWLVLWITTVFSTYRFGLWILNYQAPCTCLGVLVDWLPLQKSFVDRLLGSLLFYFFFSSSVFLFTYRKGSRRFTPKLAANSVLGLVVTTILFSAAESSNAQFALEGVIEVQEFKPNGEVFNKAAKGFTVWVKNSQWQIKTEFGPNWYTLHGCDGTNIYSLLYDPEPIVKPGQKINNSGMITKGTFPADAPWYTAIPWFAYASGQYFAKSNAQIPSIWNLPRIDFQSHIFAVDVDLYDEPGGLPKNARWTVDQNLLKTAGNNFFMKREHLPTSTKADLKKTQSLLSSIKDINGKLGATYSVLKTTNLNKLTIPTQIELVRYAIFPLGNPKAPQQMEPIIVQKYSATISRVWMEGLSSYIPEISHATDVADWRFRNGKYDLDYIQYSITNNLWPKENEPRLVAIYEHKLSRVPKVSAYSLKHGLLLIALFVFLIAPVVVFIITKLKRASK